MVSCIIWSSHLVSSGEGKQSTHCHISSSHKSCCSYLLHIYKSYHQNALHCNISYIKMKTEEAGWLSFSTTVQSWLTYHTTWRRNKFYFQVFMAVVHKLLVFIWVSALCGGWEFHWFGETYSLTFTLTDSSSDRCSSIPLNRTLFFQNTGTSYHYTVQKPKASLAINKR